MNNNEMYKYELLYYSFYKILAVARFNFLQGNV